ncbi:MAG: spore germination protein [Clostridia bacterium]|nr:spore germination protein [Clostridia bacterium]
MDIDSFDGLCDFLRTQLGAAADLTVRHIDKANCRCGIFYIRNICGRQYIADRVIAPMVKSCDESFRGGFDSLLQSAALNPCEKGEEGIQALLDGNALIAVETDKLYCAIVGADSFNHRSVSEPDSDVTVKGPRAGFTESGEGNVAALRRIIKSRRLRVKKYTVGSITGTAVFAVYLEGRADLTVLESIENVLESAKAAAVVDSGNIEQLLCPKGSFFPTMGSSEKVDKVASKIISGRVAIVCDGSPFVLTAPYVFAESIQSAEDYLKPAWYATFMRCLRFFALLASLLLPAIFTAAVYHDRGLLPSAVMESLDEMQKDIKLPFLAEILLMLTAFEIIREVGVRMPRSVGDAVGLVASLLVGDATVEAGLAGTSVLLIVAFSETAGFIVPAFNSPSVLLRYIYLFAAYGGGLYGLLFAFGLTVMSMLKKKSFGVGYMVPLYPLSVQGMDDFLLAVPKKVLGRKERLK